MRNEALTGRSFVAIAFIAFGIQHLIYGSFVTRIAPQPPRWVPAPSLWAYLLGVCLISGGAAILLRKYDRQAALSLGWLTLALTVLLHVPRWQAEPLNAGLLTFLGKGYMLSGAAFLVAASLMPADRSSRQAAYAGRGFLSLFFILCGVEHFWLTQFVATLVPSWIPGHMFWTYFAGAALIAGGVGMFIPATARLAALLSALMVLSWVILLHIPRALANLHDSNETTAVFEALAVTGAALLVAHDVARRRPELRERRATLSG